MLGVLGLRLAKGPALVKMDFLMFVELYIARLPTLQRDQRKPKG